MKSDAARVGIPVPSSPPFRSIAPRPRGACFFLAGSFLVALTAPPLGAQADFRRGDANADGIVDASDASFVSRLVFLADVFSSCMEAADANDDLTVDLSDGVRILQFLFEGRGSIPAPGPATPGPDATSGLGCVAYEPAAPPRHADLDLSFECLGPDASGAPGRHVVAVTLTTRNNTSGEGAEGWSLSIGAEGYRVLEVTHDRTAAALTTDTPPGYRDPGESFHWREVIDPDRVVGAGPQGPGAIAAVQLQTTGSAQIPADGTVRLLVLTVEEDPPGGPGPHQLFFEDGKQGSGQPVRNVITIHGAAQVPSLGRFEGCITDCNSNGTPDETDIATGSSKDCDENLLPDECDCNCACPSTPITCDPGAGPTARLGFRGSCDVGGDPERLRVRAFATLEQFCIPPGGGGAQGWSIGIEVLDGTPVSATTSGTAAAPTTEGGFRSPTRSFEKTQVIDPAKNFGRKGVVSAVVLTVEGPVIFEIPPAGGPHDILQLVVELSKSTTCPRTTLRYVENLAGTGKPLAIAVTFDGGSIDPVTDAATWHRCSGGGFQFPGDGNQDGATNIADAIWLLGHLFLGTFPVLPCDGGSASAPAPGALALLDASGDGRLDVTDPINLLNFLFTGGPPPPLGIGCVPIEGCLDTCTP